MIINIIIISIQGQITTRSKRSQARADNESGGQLLRDVSPGYDWSIFLQTPVTFSPFSFHN